MATRKTTTKKATATPTALETELKELQTMLEEIQTLAENDEEGDFSDFAGEPYISITASGQFEVGDDYNGNIDTFGSLAAVRTYFNQQKEALVKGVGLVVREIDEDCNYNASVNENGIRVGCSTIPFSKFDKIAEVVAQFRASQPAKTTRTRKTTKK